METLDQLRQRIERESENAVLLLYEFRLAGPGCTWRYHQTVTIRKP